MKDELKKAVSDALAGGKASMAVVLAGEDGNVQPLVITRPDDKRLEDIYTGDTRYPMAGLARMVMGISKGKLLLPVRECDRRMLVELQKYNQVELERLVLLGIPCSQAVADNCGCDHPFVPDGIAVTGPLAQPAQASPLPELASQDPAERLAFWMEQFSNCVRCMGCRNICPMCFCKECALDNPDIVSSESKPPDIPIFHLIRAVDMADRCVDCGMCEEICEARIPLRSLYRLARSAVKDAFGYEPGINPDEKSPLDMLGTVDELAGMEEGYRAK